MSLTSKITDQTGLPVPNKLINLYYLDKVVKSARSDNRGVATFNVTYPELRGAKTNTVISVTSDKTTYSVGDTAIITVTLKDDDGNPLSGKLITTNRYQEKTTNSEGKAVFNISYSSAGTISFNCSFEGDSNYNESAANISLEYIEAAPEINISADTSIGETGDTIQITVSATGIPPQAPLYLVEDGKETVTLDSKAYPDKMKYTCTGAGDVKLKVKYISGTNVYYSNILQIEDCFICGFNGDETFSLRSGYTGTLDISYTNNNELKYTASKSIVALMNKSFTTSKNWVVEFDMKATGYDGGRIGVQRKDSSSPEKSCVALKPQTSSVYVNLSPSETTTCTNSSIGQYSSYNHYKIIAKDGKTTLYRDNVSKTSVENNDWLNKEICLYLHGWTNSSVIYIKNFKVKAYSE